MQHNNNQPSITPSFKLSVNRVYIDDMGDGTLTVNIIGFGTVMLHKADLGLNSNTAITPRLISQLSTDPDTINNIKELAKRNSSTLTVICGENHYITARANNHTSTNLGKRLFF